MHRLVEESLLLACSNLGKNVIQQTLQKEYIPLDGTKDVLSGACQALAEDILNNVQLQIWENRCVTQKEVLSYACRSLATLIKTQCPRGAGEMVHAYGDLEYALSEDLMAMKLAGVINTRELVECVSTRHDEGLKTVLLASCQWLINDIKALFLCEEVWSNLFSNERMIHAEFYTQLRPLLSTLVFQICFQKLSIAQDVPKKTLNTKSKAPYNINHIRQKETAETQIEPLSYEPSNVLYDSRQNRPQQCSSTKVKKYFNASQYFHPQIDSSIIINNRESCVSYIIELLDAKLRQRCYSTILKLWRLLTQSDAVTSTDLFKERLCYLITFRTYPLHSTQLLPWSSCGNPAFEGDVKIQVIGQPVWPKDISVVRRWFPELSDQPTPDDKDTGNQCLQLWRINSKKVEKRQPKSFISHRALEYEDGSITSTREAPEMRPKLTVGCFRFSKTKQTLDDDDYYY